MKKLRSGKVFKDECDSLSLKASLGVINSCANMLNVRNKGTDSALKFILTNVEKRKLQATMSGECNFSTEEPSCSNSLDEKMIRNDKMSEPKVSCVVNNIVSTIEVGEPFHWMISPS